MPETYEDLIATKGRVEDQLLALPGVVGVDVGYKEVQGRRTERVAIRVYVSEKRRNVPAPEMVPATIDGAPTDVVERVPEVHSATRTSPLSIPDTTRYRPLRGGISCGPSRTTAAGKIEAGTLGVTATDMSTSRVGAITCFHVANIDTDGRIGDRLVQPSRIEGGQVPADEIGSIVRSTLSARVDGAFISIDNTISSLKDIVAYGAVTGTAAANLDMAVRERGRTTGLTYGVIDGIAGTYKIDYGNGIGERTLVDQISIAADKDKSAHFSEPGDSGAAVVDDHGNVVGLLFGGTTTGDVGYANSIRNVQNELDVAISQFQVFLLQTSIPIPIADARYYDFGIGDFDGDGKPDLFCIKKSSTGTGTLEVHILSGASNYQDFLLQTGTALSLSEVQDFTFDVGRYDGDGKPDLFCVKRSNTGTGTLEVHVLSGASNYQDFTLHTGTPLTLAQVPNFEFHVGNYDSDTSSDLFCLKRTNTGTVSLEVHVLGGASGFQKYLLETGTPLTAGDVGNFSFTLGNWNRNVPERSDLFCLKLANSATGTMEVHMLPNTSRYGNFILHSGTSLPIPDSGNFRFVAADYNRTENRDPKCELYCVKVLNSASGLVEVHILNGS